MRFIGIIPARFASTRFPGKPLAMIRGKAMVMHVYERAREAGCFTEIVVATDDERIYDHVIREGGKALMTSPDHPSGTDRVFEACMQILGENPRLEEYVVINIQGDEPFIDPAAIRSLAKVFDTPGAGIATLAKKITKKEELFDANVVKVISGKNRQALYFSRSPLPFIRDKNTSGWLSAYSFYKHIGIYAYRADILKAITALEASSLEKAEGLEQLRWLENGHPVHVEETDYESFSVDTPEDLSKLMNKA